MNADAFRHVYDYHFAENRALWTHFVLPLSEEQFTQPVPYSLGSVRNHITHLANVDHAWFSGLRGLAIPDHREPESFANRQAIRDYWDAVEAGMREYLATLRDDMLFTKPLDGEDENLMVWQVLLHVMNHATDHRAQLLRIIHDFGAKTSPQDYIFYAYDHP